MNEAIIALISAVTVAVITQGGTYILNRRQRKDSKEDKAEDSNNAVLAEIKKLSDKVDCIRKKLTEVEERADEREAIQCRVRILRFNDELISATRHSKAAFDQVLKDCRIYSAYCEKHTEFENGITEPSVENIERCYKQCMEQHDFL